MDYVAHPDYDTMKMPGICMGMSHIQDGDSHEFKLHFNDQDTEDEYNLPN